MFKVSRSLGQHRDQDLAKTAALEFPSVETVNPAVIPAEDFPPHRLREEQTWHGGVNYAHRHSFSLPVHQLRTDHGGSLWHELAGKARKLVGKSLKKGKRL